MSLKTRFNKEVKKRFEILSKEIITSIEDKTPVDTRNLKKSLKVESESELSKMIYYTTEEVEYAATVEYGDGREKNYHLEDGTIFRDIGAGMVRKTIDEMIPRLGKTFKI